MNKQKQKEILKLYLSGGINPRLYDIIKGWLAGHKEDASMDSVLLDSFDTAVTYRKPTPKTYRSLRKLQRRIGMQRRDMVRIPFTQRLAPRIAAVLIPVLIAVGTGIYFLHTPSVPEVMDIAVESTIPVHEPVEMEQVDENTAITVPDSPETSTPAITEKATNSYDINISAPAGSHRYVRLPDNSTVLLNNGGRISYSTAGREILLAGEAYFKVEKGYAQPFRVKAGNLTVNVTGTEFNVRANPGSDRTVIDLLEGSVDVAIGENRVSLSPRDELIVANKSGKTTLTKVTGNGWWEAPICFEGNTLPEILEHLEEYYGVSIEGEELVSDDVKYTIKFDKMSSLEHILDVMKEFSAEFDYTKNNTVVTVKTRDTDN